MNNLKRILCLVLTCAMTFTMLACGSAEPEASSAESGTETTAAGSETTAASAETSADPAAPSFPFSEGLTDEGLFEGVTALDHVVLPEYKGVDMPYEVYNVSEEELNAEIQPYLEECAAYEQLTDRAVQDGDSVKIIYTGSIDGVEFQGGSTGEGGTIVTIGVTNYIDDFLQQLIGHMPGETVDVNVTFPEDYGVEELNGKDALFVTKIEYIEGEKIIPELTNAFVEQNYSQVGWNSVDDMKNELTQILLSSKLTSFVTEYLTTQTQVKDIPEEIIEYEKNYVLNYFRSYADSYGVTLDEFMTGMMGCTADEYIEQSMDAVNAQATQELIYQAIAEKEGLKVTEDDVKTFFLEQTGSEDSSTYEEAWGKGYTNRMILYNMVTACIKNNANLLAE